MMKDQINRLCRLPDISECDAFRLYHAVSDLALALSEIQDLLPKLNFREVQRLAHKLGRKTPNGNTAAWVIWEMEKRRLRRSLGAATKAVALATPEPQQEAVTSEST